jgi:hypothetical protein
MKEKPLLALRGGFHCPGRSHYQQKEKIMTFGNVVSELEKAIEPLGFRIESVDRKSNIVPQNCGTYPCRTTDEGTLNIRIVRKGILDTISWVDLSDCVLSVDGISETFRP